MESLFAAGVLPDELTKLALEQIKRAQTGGRPQDHLKPGGDNVIDADMLEKFMSGENAIEDIFDAFDRITAMCVIQPECRYHRRRQVDGEGHQVMNDKNKPVWETIPDSERDDDVIYTDDVDMEDKAFIFNFVVGGSRDIASFRDEFSNAVATVQPGEDVELSSVATPQPE
jgi:hypothetical protein